MSEDKERMLEQIQEVLEMHLHELEKALTQLDHSISVFLSLAVDFEEFPLAYELMKQIRTNRLGARIHEARKITTKNEALSK